MIALVRLYAEIALLRRGPQDVPASGLLLVLTIAAYFAINSIVNWLLPAARDPWFAELTIDIVFTLAWYTGLLAAVRRKERLLQTTTAVFGYRSVIAPVTLGAEWLLRRFGAAEVWQAPLMVVVAGIAVWMIAVDTHVLKAAIEWSTFQCVTLAILGDVTGGLLLILVLPLAR